MEQHTAYKSIGCSSYDQLEAYAVKRTHCSIVYNDGSERLASGIITDVYARDGGEYLTMDDGTVIRLDHLVSVNGEPLRYAC